MAGLHVPRPLRIVRAAPAVLVVLPVPQRVKRLLPSGSRDIQALAGLKIHSRRQDMHVDTPARFAVLDRCPGVAVWFQPRPGGFLELVHHAADLRIARLVLRCPGDDARRVLVLELKRVSHVGHLVRIAPQHFDFFRVLLRGPVLILVLILFGGEVLLAGEVVRRCRCRPGSASEKLDHHRGSPRRPKCRAPAQWRPDARPPPPPQRSPCGYWPSGRSGSGSTRSAPARGCALAPVRCARPSRSAPGQLTGAPDPTAITQPSGPWCATRPAPLCWLGSSPRLRAPRSRCSLPL